MFKYKYLFFIFIIFITFTNFAKAIGPSNCPTGQVCIDNPLGNKVNDPTTGEPSFNVLIGQIINAVLGIVGSLALVMFIYGGLTWMLAAGNSEKVTKGKNILVWAAVGLIVIFSSYAIVKFVLTSLKASG